jgi:hypothetical protein
MEADGSAPGGTGAPRSKARPRASWESVEAVRIVDRVEPSDFCNWKERKRGGESDSTK